MTLITDNKALAAFCHEVAGAEYLTVDTEFMREKTYWPELCLVQVAGPGAAAAIDPLAPGIDMTPLFDLLNDPAIRKVFHAARQDLEIFLKLTGRLPLPVFDTQVAAMVCGFGESVGYETLIAKLTRARIDKSSRFTDWARRPLTEKQIKYALSDVTHLRPAYEKLRAQLEKNGREAWLEEEMAKLAEPTTYLPDPRETYRRIKSRGAKPRQMAILRELAAWRELEAQKRNLPKNRVLRDEALVEIAHHTPQDPDQLERIRGLGRGLAHGPMGQAVLAAVRAGMEMPEADWPQAPQVRPLPRGIGPAADLLKMFLKMRSDATGVASRLIASAAEVEQLAAFGEESDVPALYGWRREIYGAEALKLRDGQFGIALNDGKPVLVPTV
ncbi:MAG: ribonuclease D [Hyphomicrobiales bacterium]|nr:ribonuclease D [Hyphomicrobiales bacterium]MCP5373802.1 ribonuclease D [Hyphomicrobiales bacterium]